MIIQSVTGLIENAIIKTGNISRKGVCMQIEECLTYAFLVVAFFFCLFKNTTTKYAMIFIYRRSRVKKQLSDLTRCLDVNIRLSRSLYMYIFIYIYISIIRMTISVKCSRKKEISSEKIDNDCNSSSD